MVEVLATPEAQEQLQALPKTIRTRMLGVIERLAQWPDVSGVKPLRGALAGHYRMRTGDYRLQFRLEDGRIMIERVGHRDRFYER